MSTTILEAIDRLALAMENLTIATNVTQSQSQQAIICCEDMPPYYEEPASGIEVGTGDPPAPYPTWPEYETDRCQRAWTVVRRVRRAMEHIYDQSDVGALLGLGLIALVLAPISAPVAILVAVVALLAGAAFEGTTPARKAALSAIDSDLVCAIYNCLSVSCAKTQVDSVIDSSSLDVLSKQVLKLGYNLTTLNAIFDQTITIDPGSPTDCSECAPVGDLFRTAFTNPFNVVELGTFLTAALTGPNNGYMATNGGVDFTAEFTAPANVAQWNWETELWPNNAGFPQYPLLWIDRWTGSSWADHTGLIQLASLPNEAYHYRTALVTDKPFVSGTKYRWRSNTNDFQKSMWFRKNRIWAQE